MLDARKMVRSVVDPSTLRPIRQGSGQAFFARDDILVLRGALCLGEFQIFLVLLTSLVENV